MATVPTVHPAFRAAFGTALAYGLVLLLFVILLFVIPYVLFGTL